MCSWFWNALVLLVTVCLKCSAGQCWYYHVLSDQVWKWLFWLERDYVLKVLRKITIMVIR